MDQARPQTPSASSPASPLSAADASFRIPEILPRRRLFVAALNGASFLALAGAMAYVLAAGGWSWPEMGMYAPCLVTLAWLVIGFWNAVIGMVLLARNRTDDDPLALKDVPEMPITTRTAMVIAVRNAEAAPLSAGCAPLSRTSRRAASRPESTSTSCRTPTIRRSPPRRGRAGRTTRPPCPTSSAASCAGARAQCSISSSSACRG